jgi:hypothetical protein
VTTAPPQTTTTVTTAAVIRSYCDALHADHFADVTLYDDAMRPLLVRLVRASAYRSRDAKLAADTTALLSARASSLSSAALAPVPAPLRADIRAIRAEKLAILRNVVLGANGDQAGVQFIVQSESNEGGVMSQVLRSSAFLRTHCPAADVAATGPAAP